MLLTWTLSTSLALGQFGTVINVPPEPEIGNNQSIGSNTQLNLFDQGSIGESFQAGASDGTSTNVEVNIAGGEAGNDFRANGGSVVNISGGLVGNRYGRFVANSGSIVNISGGLVGRDFVANSGSVVNIFGGAMDRLFHAKSGSVVNLSGGSVGHTFNAESGSLLNISGGAVGDGLQADSGSAVQCLRRRVSFGRCADRWARHGGQHPGRRRARRIRVERHAGRRQFICLLECGSGAIADGTLTLVAAVLPAAGPPVIMLPARPAPRGLRSGQTLVVSFGGEVGNNFNAAWNSKVHIAGGEVGNHFEAVGADVTNSGGSVGRDFEAFDGTVVNVTGGTVGANFQALSGSRVNISGGTIGDSFGAAGPNVEVNISGGSVGDSFGAGSFVGAPSNDVVVNISGGTVGVNFFATTGSAVNITGGKVGAGFDAFSGSEVNISGGSVDSQFRANLGSLVNIAGGSVGAEFEALSDSTVNISGGAVGDEFRGRSGSEVNLWGGEFRLDGVPFDGLDTVGSTLTLDPSPDSVLSGTLSDGTPFAFSHIDSDFFSASTLTLRAAELPPVGPADIHVPGDPAPLGIRSGQTLVVENSGAVADNFNAGHSSAVVIAGGRVGNNFEAVGAEVTITGGLVGDDFDALSGSLVNLSGGTIGNFLDAAGSEINITGGSVGRGFDVFAGSTVNISGGSIGNNFHASGGSEVNISEGSFGTFSVSDGSVINITGGSFGGNVFADSGSTVNISGRAAGDRFFAFGGSTVNISGGSTSGELDALSGSEVNLMGAEFLLGSMDITSSLTPNLPFTISDRDVTLSGQLADGTPFRLDLNSTDAFGEDFFDPGATLTVTLLSSVLSGDFNGNGTVDAADYTVWRDTLGQAGDGLAADADGDNVVTQLDFDVWKTNFGNTAGSAALLNATVAKPVTGLMLILGMATTLWTRSSSRHRRLRVELLEDRRLLATITVNSLADNISDDGLITLREAIVAANDDAVADPTEGTQAGSGADTIEFDPLLFTSGPGTIWLTEGELLVTSDLAIQGPGARILTINAAGTDPTSEQDNGDGSRIFNIDDGHDAANIDVGIHSLTLTGGDVSGAGGGIRSVENLTVVHAEIIGNSAIGNGGGIYVHISNNGTTTISSSTIANNSAEDNGGGIFAVTENNSTTVSLRTISGNSAVGIPGHETAGGGIYARTEGGGTTAIRHSTILSNQGPDNSANTEGGGIYAVGEPPILDHTIVANNIAPVHFADGADVSGTFLANFSLIKRPAGATIFGANNMPVVEFPVIELSFTVKLPKLRTPPPGLNLPAVEQPYPHRQCRRPGRPYLDRCPDRRDRKLDRPHRLQGCRVEVRA